jgi:protein O-GlcNAc transferase
LLAEHRRWNELHARALAPGLPPRTEAGPGRKLRVGYVSADFKRHSLAYFIEPLLANHDRDRFEVYCYSNTRKTDEVTDQLRNHVSQWRDITAVSDEAAAGLIGQDGIDILVDLSGHTAGSRLLVFARKPAPVQLTFLGYPNTTGLATMDYRISDGYMDPPGIADAFYTEQLLRMPHSLWCYRPPAPTPDVNPLPALQLGATTFGSLHSFTKLNRTVIDLWARILARAPDSQLLLAGAPAGETGTRLRERFAAHGVDAARVHLIGKVNFDDYLKLYHRIDIALDAFPYTGGTTTCESLWMGVPVVTLAGTYAVARAGVSLLTSAGLTELIADSPERYVEIAVDLAHDTHRLVGLRGSLRERMQRSPLMDETAYTRAFEALLHGAFQAVTASTEARGLGPASVTR